MEIFHQVTHYDKPPTKLHRLSEKCEHNFPSKEGYVNLADCMIYRCAHCGGHEVVLKWHALHRDFIEYHTKKECKEKAGPRLPLQIEFEYHN